MEYRIEEIQSIIGYTFNNIELLYKAMTHSSYVNDHKIDKLKCNERLEFLGDAVLELLSSEYIYDNYPEKPEGELTKLRASLVSEFPLANVAREIGLGQYILLSKGEENTGGRERDSITSDAVEALLGAIYIDGGMEPARKFVYKYIVNDIENKQLFNDSKTILQEIVQKYKLGILSYKLVREDGPDHMKEYEVNCVLDSKIIGNGVGKTKKNAQQKAAYDAINKLKKRKFR
jgi:ribonuclease-3